MLGSIVPAATVLASRYEKLGLVVLDFSAPCFLCENLRIACYALIQWGSSEQTRSRNCGQRNAPKTSEVMHTIFRVCWIRPRNHESREQSAVTRKSAKRTNLHCFDETGGAKASLRVDVMFRVREIRTWSDGSQDCFASMKS